jgi:superfamily II DNA/RNA helicase
VNDFISLVLKAHPLALNSTLLIGGLPLKDQRKEMLVKKPQVIVGTMGRITEAIEKEYVKVEQIKLVIFDEADRFRVTDEQNVNFQNVKTLLEQVIQA